MPIPNFPKIDPSQFPHAQAVSSIEALLCAPDVASLAEHPQSVFKMVCMSVSLFVVRCSLTDRSVRARNNSVVRCSFGIVRAPVGEVSSSCIDATARAGAAASAFDIVVVDGGANDQFHNDVDVVAVDVAHECDNGDNIDDDNDDDCCVACYVVIVADTQRDCGKR